MSPAKKSSGPSVGVQAADGSGDDVTITVVVAANTQVQHDGTLYGGGEEVTLPAELADRYLAAGWVEKKPG